MDKIYNFKSASPVGHLQSVQVQDNQKQFFSEEETKPKSKDEQQIKKQSKPPSKMSQFSQSASGYQTDDSDRETPKHSKVGPTNQKMSKFRNLQNTKQVEGDNEQDPNFSDDEGQQTKLQQFEGQYNVDQQSSQLQQKYAQPKSKLTAKVKQNNTISRQSASTQAIVVNSDNEQVKNKTNKDDKMKSHQFRHLIYGPTIGEATFKKFLLLTQRGLIYARKCLKGPSDKFIKSKQVTLAEHPIPKPKTLLLDLDETLIHSCSQRENPQICVTAYGDYGEEAKIYFNVRPFCSWFLQQMSTIYTIYVYTASSSAYANAIVSFLDPKRQWILGILSRGNCMETKNGFFIKDLRIIGNKLVKDMLIVDNLAHSFGFQIENGVPILEWHNDQNDQELKYMATYLMEAAEHDDLGVFNSQRLKLDNLIEYNLEQ